MDAEADEEYLTKMITELLITENLPDHISIPFVKLLLQFKKTPNKSAVKVIFAKYTNPEIINYLPSEFLDSIGLISTLPPGLLMQTIKNMDTKDFEKRALSYINVITRTKSSDVSKEFSMRLATANIGNDKIHQIFEMLGPDAFTDDFRAAASNIDFFVSKETASSVTDFSDAAFWIAHLQKPQEFIEADKLNKYIQEMDTIKLSKIMSVELRSDVLKTLAFWRRICKEVPRENLGSNNVLRCFAANTAPDALPQQVLLELLDSPQDISCGLYQL